MPEQKEMLKVETWVICLLSFDTDEPSFYYNHVDDKFERNFNNQCAFLVESECVKKEKELELYCTQVVKGTMDVPRNILIDTIMEVFVEQGIVKK